MYASKTELLCTDQPLQNLSLWFWGKIYTRYKLGSYLLRFAISLSFLINFSPYSFLSFACSDFADNMYLNDYWSKQCKEMCRANIKCSFLLALTYPSSFRNPCFPLKPLLYTWTFKGSQSAGLATNVSHGALICPLTGWHKKSKNLIYGLCVWKEKILSIQFLLERERCEIFSIGCSSFQLEVNNIGYQSFLNLFKPFVSYRFPLHFVGRGSVFLVTCHHSKLY